MGTSAAYKKVIANSPPQTVEAAPLPENRVAELQKQVLALQTEIEERKRRERALQTANHNLLRRIDDLESDLFTDPLTGVFNRKGLAHAMNAIAQPSSDHRLQMGTHAIMMIDLNGFKHINDTHGHLAGDEALRTVASGLKNLVREGDIVSRVGGDEFVVFLHNLTEENLEVKISDVNAMFANLSFQWGVNRVMVGGSVGSWAMDYNMSVEMNIEQADKLMYRQKQMDKAGLDLILM